MKSRDSSAYSYLYDHYARSLYTVIAQIVPDVSVANDVLQETFIHVWTKIDTYNPRKGRLFTWLLQIARQVAYCLKWERGGHCFLVATYSSIKLRAPA